MPSLRDDSRTYLCYISLKYREETSPLYQPPDPAAQNQMEDRFWLRKQ